MSDAKRQVRWSQIKVGLVITVAFLVLLIAVFFAGNIQNIFLKKAEFKIQFKDVVGLRKGAPVWILGLEEGSVNDITLDPVYGVIVRITVNRNALQFVKKDSRATILTMGLLGDKYIELSTGSPQAEPIRPGEMIQGTSEIGFREVMGQFIDRIDSLVTKIERGQGTIAKLINDPALYNNLLGATQSLSALLEDAKSPKGTLGLLIEDPTVYRKMLAATSSIEEFAKKINQSSGTLRHLIEDPSLYDKALTAASQIEEFSKKLNQSQGTLRRIIEDPALYDNLNKDLKKIHSILEKIESGEGVAGALIQDKELAKELKDTVAELKEVLKNIKEHPKKYFKFSIF